MKRVLSVVLLFVALQVPSALGEGRVLSVYLESIAAMQGQILQAAQLFETPELGAAPMMFNMMVPGYVQVDRDEPVGLHVFVGEEGDYSVVVDVQPLDSAEHLLGAVLANMGLMVPEPVDGRYTTEFVVAQIQGERVLLGQDAEKVDMALRIGVPEDMPEISGFLRIEMFPPTLLTLWNSVESMMQDSVSSDAPQVMMFAQSMNVYRRIMEQIASYQIGIGIREDGLAVRSSMLPTQGRALAGIVDTVQGVDPAWVSSMDEPRMVSMITGQMDVRGDVKQTLLDLYVDWVQHLPEGQEMNADLAQASMEPILEMMGAGSFTFLDISEAGELRVQSGSLLENAAEILQQMIELTERDDYQASMQDSGMKMIGPDVREVEGVDVYRWSMEFDEAHFFENMDDSGEMDHEHVALVKTFMEKIFSKYDYAALDEGLIYSMPDDAQLMQAIELLRKTSDADAVDSSTILQQINPPVMPYTIGRFDFLALLHSLRNLGVSQLPPIPAEGEGIIMSGWREGDNVEQLLLIPAADIRAIRQATSRTVR